MTIIVAFPTPPVSQYELAFGGDAVVSPRFFLANGEATSGAIMALDERTEHSAPRAGRLLSLGYRTMSGDATTVLEVLADGGVVETITLIAASGVATGLTTAIAGGTTLAIRFAAGTAPRNSNFDLLVGT